MQLGWIDFSKSERNKVLNVLDMLSEAGISAIIHYLIFVLVLMFFKISSI